MTKYICTPIAWAVEINDKKISALAGTAWAIHLENKPAFDSQQIKVIICGLNIRKGLHVLLVQDNSSVSGAIQIRRKTWAVLRRTIDHAFKIIKLIEKEHPDIDRKDTPPTAPIELDYDPYTLTLYRRWIDKNEWPMLRAIIHDEVKELRTYHIRSQRREELRIALEKMVDETQHLNPPSLERARQVIQNEYRANMVSHQ